MRFCAQMCARCAPWVCLASKLCYYWNVLVSEISARSTCLRAFRQKPAQNSKQPEMNARWKIQVLLFHCMLVGGEGGPQCINCYQIEELMIEYYHLIWLFRMFYWHDLTLIGNSSRFAMKVLKTHAKWAGIMVNWFLMLNWFAPHHTAPAHAGTVITAFFTSALRNLEASLCNFLAMASGFRDLTLKQCICNP